MAVLSKVNCFGCATCIPCPITSLFWKQQKSKFLRLQVILIWKLYWLNRPLQKPVLFVKVLLWSTTQELLGLLLLSFVSSQTICFKMLYIIFHTVLIILRKHTKHAKFWFWGAVPPFKIFIPYLQMESCSDTVLSSGLNLPCMKWSHIWLIGS